MAKTQNEVVPSLLDRLIDEDPTARSERPKSSAQTMTDLQAAVGRDLENLLNARVRASACPEELVEVRSSVVNYGIPDIAGSDLGSQLGQREFLSKVESAIRYFEPRFSRVRVIPAANDDYLDRTLRFRIEATLQISATPMQVVFDSTIQPASGRFEVKEANS